MKSPGLVAPPYNSMWKVFTPWPSSAILIRYTSGFANGVADEDRTKTATA